MRRPAAKCRSRASALVSGLRWRAPATQGEGTVEISARNQLSGTVQAIKTGAVMAEIIVNVDAGTVAAVITDSSREQLSLNEGDQVTVIIKATEVMIGK